MSSLRDVATAEIAALKKDAENGWTYRHIAACLGANHSLEDRPLSGCRSCKALREWDEDEP